VQDVYAEAAKKLYQHTMYAPPTPFAPPGVAGNVPPVVAGQPMGPALTNVVEGEFVVVPPPQPVLAPSAPVPPPAHLGPDASKNEAELTAEYIELRNAKKSMAERQAEELAPYNDRMIAIEQTMLARLNASGVESVRTTEGTAFKKMTTRYNVEDAEKLFPWIEANGQTDMLARSVKQDAVREYFETTGHLPPGIGVFSQIGVQFRK
jgi:hypothetical protein